MAQRISDMSAGSMPYAREALPYASLQRGLGGMNPPNPGMTNMDDGRLDPFLNAQTERQNQYEMQDINQNMTSARPQAAAGAMGQARTAIVEESDAQSKAQQDLNNKMAMVIEASGSGQNIAALNERMMTDREGFDNNMATSNAIAMAMKA
jgi:hypothetical protein|tara:strand:- start:756 stop:1208 length:453 start_codon:yes stop_codon:yes gene_type:complete